MNQGNTELDGPDFTHGVEISTVPDGTMLLGHVRGEAVLLVRRGDESVRDWRHLHALWRTHLSAAFS